MHVTSEVGDRLPRLGIDLQCSRREQPDLGVKVMPLLGQWMCSIAARLEPSPLSVVYSDRNVGLTESQFDYLLVLLLSSLQPS